MSRNHLFLSAASVAMKVLAIGSLASVMATQAFATPPLTIKFKNSSGLPDSQVYVGFLGSADLAATNIQTGAPISQTLFGDEHWYTLADVPQGISLTSFSGRIYLGYGTPWTLLRAGYEPSPVSTGDPNYLKRWDKVEFTYHGAQADVVDTTSIDYYGIRTGVKVFKNGTSGTLVKELKDATTQQAIDALKSLTTPENGAVVMNGADFVRILGPSVYPDPPELPASPYVTFGDYLTFLHDTYAPLHAGTIATIEGQFAGVGDNPQTPETKPQHYSFVATMNAGLDITLSGSGDEIGARTITISHDELIYPTGIYGANPFFRIGTGDPIKAANDVYGWILGDLLAGLNIGALGSSVVVNGVEVGQMNSQAWFGLTSMFAALQPGHPKNYNQWAHAMAAISDAYNFAYSDRFAHVSAPLDPALVDTMEVEIGDGAPASSCPADLNHDSVVDDADFVVFAAAYNILDCADPAMPAGCPADLNADQVVDDADFVIFVAAYNALLCP